MENPIANAGSKPVRTQQVEPTGASVPNPSSKHTHPKSRTARLGLGNLGCPAVNSNPESMYISWQSDPGRKAKSFWSSTHLTVRGSAASDQRSHESQRFETLAGKHEPNALQWHACIPGDDYRSESEGQPGFQKLAIEVPLLVEAAVACMPGSMRSGTSTRLIALEAEQV